MNNIAWVTMNNKIWATIKNTIWVTIELHAQSSVTEQNKIVLSIVA